MWEPQPTAGDHRPDYGFFPDEQTRESVLPADGRLTLLQKAVAPFRDCPLFPPPFRRKMGLSPRWRWSSAAAPGPTPSRDLLIPRAAGRPGPSVVHGQSGPEERVLEMGVGSTDLGGEEGGIGMACRAFEPSRFLYAALQVLRARAPKLQSTVHFM